MRWMTIPTTLLSLFGCQDSVPPREFDGEAALAAVRTQVAFGPRIDGTAGHDRMAQWLDSLLRTRADTLVVQAWSHKDEKGNILDLRNYVARFNLAATDRILFLAHWDTRPISDGPTSKDSSAAVPGANDGGSGVAILLGVAAALKKSPPPADLGVDLLFDDGEDYGVFADTVDVLMGTRYYASHPPSGPKPRFAVLFDMVGSKGLKIYQENNSLTGAPDVVALVWKTAASIGHSGTFIDSGKHTLIDDHLTLQQVGIRAIDVVDFDYPYWHTPEDTPDKVSAASLQIVGDVAMAIVRKKGK